MSLPDTAEYWHDVKRRYSGPDYFHIPGYDCGRKHWYEAKYIDEVNCRECKQALESGIAHNLLSTDQHQIYKERKLEQRVAKIKKKWIKAHPNNPICECGFVMLERQNKFNGNKFWGCSQYPRCEKTKPLIKEG